MSSLKNQWTQNISKFKTPRWPNIHSNQRIKPPELNKTYVSQTQTNYEHIFLNFSWLSLKNCLMNGVFLILWIFSSKQGENELWSTFWITKSLLMQNISKWLMKIVFSHWKRENSHDELGQKKKFWVLKKSFGLAVFRMLGAIDNTGVAAVWRAFSGTVYAELRKVCEI